MSGTKAPRGSSLSEELHKAAEEAAVASRHLPEAQQRCSAWGSLRLGMSCFGLRREFCSPSPDEEGYQCAQHDVREKRDVLARVSRALGAASAAVPLCLPTDSGSVSKLPWSLCQRVVWAVSSSGRGAEGSQEPGTPAWAAGAPCEGCSLGNHAGKPQPTPTRSLLLLARFSEQS